MPGLRSAQLQQAYFRLLRMSNSQTWYIVKQNSGQCEILPHLPVEEELKGAEKWGPFDSEAEAIARRVGLIRSGKCQPV
ncbi:MAG: transposase [Leptolyngbyaceae cyanobacterium RM2_2_4]|nr:transposase [Leptolyngbyaceae cyanobacterium SM1_4_3]NJO52531.1 transposase [Leptolyngbyaceae cyanobacterium RM2_2_4]NJO74516.1 transposase [Leptolyngbyaceae cyanobacterium RM1_406_9]